jgi:hypothetical protein
MFLIISSAFSSISVKDHLFCKNLELVPIVSTVNLYYYCLLNASDKTLKAITAETQI